VIREALRDHPIVLPLMAIALILLVAQSVGSLFGWT
jgi:hypothetical protein